MYGSCDQTIPNILAIEAFRPEELLLISTRRMEAKGKSEHILNCLSYRGLNFRSLHRILTVAENSLIDCRRALESWVQGKEDSDFVVNLTGGTKIMSIAAYEFFKEYNCEMIYIPIGCNDYVRVFPRRGSQQPVPLAQRFKVAGYLKAYGLTSLNTRHLPGMANEALSRQALSTWITTNYFNLKNLLAFFSESLRSHRDDKWFFFNGTFAGATEDEKKLLERMGFSVRGNELEKELTKSEIQFLTGGWLEEYCFTTVYSFVGHGIDDAVIGIQIKNPNGTDNEFDILFTCGNALYTVECKSLDQEADRFFREKWTNPFPDGLFWLSLNAFRAGEHTEALQAADELQAYQPGYPKLDRLLRLIGGEGEEL